MASSGVQTFTLTVQEMIDLALIDLRGLPVGETSTAAETSDAIKRLNLLLRSLENEGIHLWKVDSQTITTTADDGTYDLATGTNKFLHAYITDSSNNDTPLNILTMAQYDSIVDKTVTGVPTDVCVIYNSDPPNVLLYPVPDAEYTITYRRTKQCDSVTAGTETFDASDTALPMIHKGLVSALATSYEKGLDERTLILQEFIAEKVKYLSQNTERRGNEIQKPRGLDIV